MFMKGKKHGVGIESNLKEIGKYISVYENDRLIYKKEVNLLDEQDNDFLDVKRLYFQ